MLRQSIILEYSNGIVTLQFFCVVGDLDLIRTEVFFSGRVQGVGFRYMALQVSRSFDVCGTVQNLADGRVKMVLEGKSGSIQRFVDEVCESTDGHVSEVERAELPATGEFSGFHVVR